MLLPLSVNIPILVVTSMTIRHALDIPGSLMAEESFLWIEKLGKGDMGLGAIGGLMAMVHAEVSAMQRRRKELVAPKLEEDKEDEVEEQEEQRPVQAIVPPRKRSTSRHRSISLVVPEHQHRSLSTTSVTSTPQTPKSPFSATRKPVPPPSPPSKPTTTLRFPMKTVDAKTGQTTPAKLIDVDPGIPNADRQADLLSKVSVNLVRAQGLFFFCVGPIVPAVSHSYSAWTVAG